MIDIVIFGTGNVATHLFQALNSAETTRVVQVYNHHSDSLSFFKDKTEVTSSLTTLKKAEVYILALKDDAVRQVAQQLQDREVLLVHTAGSIPLLSAAKRNGVFYPLQTFSKKEPLDFSSIPLCIEATFPEDLKLLKQIGRGISKKVYSVSSSQRRSLHLAAVFACNFSNALYDIAESICEENALPFEILHPLIKETARKIEHNSPREVQTGPAIRFDQKVIEAQLQQLRTPEQKEIYTLFTELIQKKHEREL